MSERLDADLQTQLRELATFMRLGAAISKQAFGVFLVEDGSTCALGSVAVASGLGLHVGYCVSQTDYAGDLKRIRDKFPILKLNSDGCDLCGESIAGKNPSLFTMVMHWNDWHKWTRQQIADHIEALADQLPCSSITKTEEPDSVDTHPTTSPGLYPSMVASPF
jgi:hypothetical protein